MHIAALNQPALDLTLQSLTQPHSKLTAKDQIVSSFLQAEFNELGHELFYAVQKSGRDFIYEISAPVLGLPRLHELSVFESEAKNKMAYGLVYQCFLEPKLTLGTEAIKRFDEHYAEALYAEQVAQYGYSNDRDVVDALNAVEEECIDLTGVRFRMEDTQQVTAAAVFQLHIYLHKGETILEAQTAETGSPAKLIYSCQFPGGKAILHAPREFSRTGSPASGDFDALKLASALFLDWGYSLRNREIL